MKKRPKDLNREPILVLGEKWFGQKNKEFGLDETRLNKLKQEA